MTTIMTAFTSSGVPKTGLTPVITAYDMADNSVVVNAQNMSEVGLGIYKYVFSGYDPLKEYAIYVDGGATLANSERYQYGSSQSVSDIPSAILEELLIGHTTTGSVGEKLNNVPGEIKYIDGGELPLY